MGFPQIIPLSRMEAGTDMLEEEDFRYWYERCEYFLDRIYRAKAFPDQDMPIPQMQNIQTLRRLAELLLSQVIRDGIP